MSMLDSCLFALFSIDFECNVKLFTVDVALANSIIAIEISSVIH